MLRYSPNSRRSALISLSDVTDQRMKTAKQGNWWETHPHRALANNSAVYENRRPDMPLFMDEWKSLHDSRSGEGECSPDMLVTTLLNITGEERQGMNGEQTLVLKLSYGLSSSVT